MGYWLRYNKRKSLVSNWRIISYVNGLKETKFKVQYKGYFGIWHTHKLMMGYDGSSYTVWYGTYEDAKQFIDASVLNHQKEIIRLNVAVGVIEFL